MQKRRFHSALLLLAAGFPGWSSDLALRNAPAQVFFSPRGGCTEAVVERLRAARKTVLVQAYSFTSAPIAGALKEARDRGVEVRVILDKSQRTEHYSSATFLLHAGVPTWIDRSHAIAHNKVMVIDGEVVITGSFNFCDPPDASLRNRTDLRFSIFTNRPIREWLLK